MAQEDKPGNQSTRRISAESGRALAEIARRHRIRLVIAFGSQVRGKTHAESDLDLAVLVEPPGDGQDELGLIADLQRLFPGQDVDVIWMHRADPLLAWEICRVAQLLHGDRRDMVRYATYAWRRFVEYRRFFSLEADAVQRSIARLRHAY